MPINIRDASIYFIAVFSFFFSNISDAQPKAEHVFILSIDGGKPQVIKSSNMPTLHSLLAKSALTWQATTVSPNVTLPSHASMLTGVTPRLHNITWNSWKPERGHVKFQTIFGRAKSAGFKTALFAGKEKFNHLNAPGTLNKFSVLNGSSAISKAAADYIVAQKPNLTFVHFPDADHAGHRFGWGSGRQKAALKTIDQGIATIMSSIERAGIASNSVVIITADHGGFGLGHSFRIPANYKIPWIVLGKRIRKGRQLSPDIRTIDTAATALWLLDVNANNLEGRAITEAFEGL